MAAAAAVTHNYNIVVDANNIRSIRKTYGNGVNAVSQLVQSNIIFLNKNNYLQRFYCDIIKDSQENPPIGTILNVLNQCIPPPPPSPIPPTIAQYHSILEQLDRTVIQQCESQITEYKNILKTSTVGSNIQISDAEHLFWESGFSCRSICRNPRMKTIKTPAATLDSLPKQSYDDLFNPYVKFTSFFSTELGFPTGFEWQTVPNANQNESDVTITFGAGMVESHSINNLNRNIRGFAPFVLGNRDKNHSINNLNIGVQADRDRIKKLLIMKEIGDVAQVWMYLAYADINGIPRNQLLMVTTDSVVYLLCMLLDLSCIYTGARAGVQSGCCTLKHYLSGNVDYIARCKNMMEVYKQKVVQHNTSITFALKIMLADPSNFDYYIYNGPPPVGGAPVPPNACRRVLATRGLTADLRVRVNQIIQREINRIELATAAIEAIFVNVTKILTIIEALQPEQAAAFAAYHYVIAASQAAGAAEAAAAAAPPAAGAPPAAAVPAEAVRANTVLTVTVPLPLVPPGGGAQLNSAAETAGVNAAQQTVITAAATAAAAVARLQAGAPGALVAGAAAAAVAGVQAAGQVATDLINALAAAVVPPGAAAAVQALIPAAPAAPAGPAAPAAAVQAVQAVAAAVAAAVAVPAPAPLGPAPAVEAAALIAAAAGRAAGAAAAKAQVAKLLAQRANVNMATVTQEVLTVPTISVVTFAAQVVTNVAAGALGMVNQAINDTYSNFCKSIDIFKEPALFTQLPNKRYIILPGRFLTEFVACINGANLPPNIPQNIDNIIASVQAAAAAANVRIYGGSRNRIQHAGAREEASVGTKRGSNGNPVGWGDETIVPDIDTNFYDCLIACYVADSVITTSRPPPVSNPVPDPAVGLGRPPGPNNNNYDYPATNNVNDANEVNEALYNKQIAFALKWDQIVNKLMEEEHTAIYNQQSTPERYGLSIYINKLNAQTVSDASIIARGARLLKFVYLASDLAVETAELEKRISQAQMAYNYPPGISFINPVQKDWIIDTRFHDWLRSKLGRRRGLEDADLTTALFTPSMRCGNTYDRITNKRIDPAFGIQIGRQCYDVTTFVDWLKNNNDTVDSLIDFYTRTPLTPQIKGEIANYIIMVYRLTPLVMTKLGTFMTPKMVAFQREFNNPRQMSKEFHGRVGGNTADKRKTIKRKLHYKNKSKNQKIVNKHRMTRRNNNNTHRRTRKHRN